MPSGVVNSSTRNAAGLNACATAVVAHNAIPIPVQTAKLASHTRARQIFLLIMRLYLKL
jgi:hypothetical protein